MTMRSIRVWAVRAMCVAALALFAGCCCNQPNPCNPPCIPPPYSCNPTDKPCLCWPGYSPNGQAPFGSDLLQYIIEQCDWHLSPNNCAPPSDPGLLPQWDAMRQSWQTLKTRAEGMRDYGKDCQHHTCDQLYQITLNCRNEVMQRAGQCVFAPDCSELNHPH